MKARIKQKAKNSPKGNAGVVVRHSGRFKKGHPKMGGRKKGTPNKFTTLKQAFVDAFVGLGGAEGLQEWADSNRSNRAMFYSFITKMLPKEVVLQGPGENPEELPLVVRIESREKK